MKNRRQSTLLWLLPALLWHAVGLSLFVNWRDVVDNPPLHYTDYAVHYAQTEAVCQFQQTAGRLWGYSPYFHAGYAEGTLFDVDNKFVAVASCLLNRLGPNLPLAYNLVMAALLVCAPFGVFAAARLIGEPARSAGIAQLFGLALWYGDATISWMWRGGGIAFLVAALGSLVVMAAFWRWAGLTQPRLPGGEPAAGTAAEMPHRWGPPAALLTWFVLGPILFWLHAFSFVMLVIPIGPGLLIAWRRLTWRRRVLPFVWAGWVILLNWPWLGTLLRFLPTRVSSAQFLQGGLSMLLADARAPYGFLRLAILVLAVFGLVAWRAERRLHWMPAAATIFGLIGLAYLGIYVGAGDLQPARFVAPALLLAALPAAVVLDRAAVRSARRTLLVVTVSLLVAIPALWVARPRHILQADGTPADFLSGPRAAEQQVCAALHQLDVSQGRVLTNDWRLGAYLPTCSGAQVIGGPFLWVWTVYGYTNAGLDDVLQQPLRQLSPADLQSIMAQYNIQWAVVNTEVFGDGYTLADWDRDHPGPLTLRQTIDNLAIYEVEQPASWFAQGHGQVQAGFDRLRVTQASAGGVTLKYHWIEGLRSEPPLPIRPVSIGADPVPFIAVDNGNTAAFDIYFP